MQQILSYREASQRRGPEGASGKGLEDADWTEALGMGICTHRIGLEHLRSRLTRSGLYGPSNLDVGDDAYYGGPR